MLLGFKNLILSVLVIATLGCGPGTAIAEASAGQLDPTFGTNGFATQPLGSWAVNAAAAVQSDGKVVTAGEALVNGERVMVSERLTATGALDPSYGVGGVVTISLGGYGCANALVIQPDGKIVLAGTGNGNGALDFAAVRLNSNGSLDTGFGHGGIVTIPIGGAAIANAVALTSTGQLVLVGTTHTSDYHMAAARLNANGTLDSSFGGKGTTILGPVGVAWGMVQQANGNVVLAGDETTNGTKVFAAARLLTSGKLDSTFARSGVVGVPIGATATAVAVGLQPDGSILMTGNATDSDGSSEVPTVRLTTRGALDPTFGSGGVAHIKGCGVNALAIQGDGKIVLAGVGATAVRLTNSGALDSTFGNGGVAFATTGTNDAANGVAIEPTDGKVVLSGVATIGGVMELDVMRLAA